MDAVDTYLELRRAVSDCDWDGVRIPARAVLEAGLGEAAEVAREVGAFDVEMLASVLDGMRLVSLGRLNEAWARLDEAILAACTGELTDQLIVMLVTGGKQALQTLARDNRVPIGPGTWACPGLYARVSAPGAIRVGAPFTVTRGDTARQADQEPASKSRTC